MEENRKKRAPFVHGEGRGRGGRRDDNIIQTRSIFDQSTIITTPANSVCWFCFFFFSINFNSILMKNTPSFFFM